MGLRLALCCVVWATAGVAAVLSSQTKTSLEAPALVSHVLPAYPDIARSARVEGLVEVTASIGSDGRVTVVRVSRSVPLLDGAALEAVRRWRFAPPSGTSADVRVSFRFALNDPFRYPRPATYLEQVPSWLPKNFAFVYTYQCASTNVEIDSIARSVTNGRGHPPKGRRFAFGFDVGQASDVFVTLVGAGFFDASTAGGRGSARRDQSTWREQARVESAISRAGDRISVTVAAEVPVIDVSSSPRQIQRSGDQPSFLHILKVRRDDRWTDDRWIEPLPPNRPEHEKALERAGKGIRALVRTHVTDARMRPQCL